MAIKDGKKYLSIAIKSEHIRICELSKKKKNIKVYRTFRIATPAGTVTDGNIEDMKEVAGAITQAIETNGIKTRDVIFTIISSKVASKEVVIPGVKDNRIAELVEANASEYFPVDVDQYVIRHTVLQKFKEDDAAKIRLQLTAVPKTIVEEYYLLAQTTGLRIATIDNYGNSIYQIIKHQLGQEYCAVINIEGESTMVNIFEDNILKLQRSVPYGSNNIYEAVMNEYDLATDIDARAYIEQEELFNIRPEEFSGNDEFAESLEYLIRSVKKILEFYISRNQGNQPEKMFVIGDIANIKHFDELLTSEIGTEATVIKGFGNITIEKSAKIKGRNITAYTGVIGALIKPADIVIDEKQEAEKGAGNRVYALVLLLAVLLGVVLVILPLMDKMEAEEKLTRSRTNVNSMSYVEDVVNEYYESKDKYTDVLAFKSLSSGSNDTLYEFITMLEQYMPSDISISNMSVAGGSVSISASAASKSSVAKFMQQIQKIDTVENVYVGSLSESKDNLENVSVSFTLTCTFTNVAIRIEEETSEEETEEPTTGDNEVGTGSALTTAGEEETADDAETVDVEAESSAAEEETTGGATNG